MRSVKRFIALLICFVFILCAGCKNDEGAKEDAVDAATKGSTAETSATELSGDENHGDGETDELKLGELNMGYDVDEGAPTADSDLVVIQLDNTAAFAVDSGVMPKLSAFAKNNAYYNSFYAQQGEEEGIYSALTSLYAPLEDIDKEGEYHSLAHIFAKNGYKTHGFNISSMDETMAKTLGFDGLTEELDLTLLNNGDKDFIFTELKVIESPYIPLSIEGIAIEGNRSLNSYLCCAANLDSALGDLLEAITTAGGDAPTIIIYGTAPKLDGKFTTYRDEYPELFGKGFSYDQVYKTPFVISYGGIEGGVRADFATVYDIYPTLAALYGFDGSEMLVSGENLYMNSKLPAPSTDPQEVVNLDSFRFFAPQGEYMRGCFITDTVYYTKGGGVSSVYAKATMTELSARDYKDCYKAVLTTINESEYAVECGYFGGKTSIEAMYGNLPATSDLTLSIEAGAADSGSMVGSKGYLSHFNTKYTAAALTGIWDGITLKDGCLVLAEGAKTGSVITDVLEIGDFEKLYIVPQGTLNGGAISIYITYPSDNGVNTPWTLVDSYTDNGATTSLGALDIKATDGSAFAAKSMRIKIELSASNGAAPIIEGLNIAPVLTSEAVQELPAIEEEVKVSTVLGYGEGIDSGIAAVELLTSSALSVECDFENALAFLCSSPTSCTLDCKAGSTASLARYAQEKGLNAFVDCYGIKEIMTAIDCDQPIVMKTEDGYVIAIGYSQNGITVVNPCNGEEYVITFEDIKINTEVLIVDSTLRTPEIIEDIIAEDSAVRPGIVVDKKKYIVIHCTGNYATGSTAAAHAAYLHGLANSPDRSVSWHYTVDKDEIYHHLPDNESAWHASDGTHGEGNKYGIGIETCVNGFPGKYSGEEYNEWLKGFTVTVKNLSYLVAKLMIENDIGMDGIKQHWDFAPDKKNCPMQMRYCSGTDTFEHEGDMWVYLMGQIELQYNRLIEEGYGQ